MAIQLGLSLMAIALNLSGRTGQMKISESNLMMQVTITLGSFFHLIPDSIENQYNY